MRTRTLPLVLLFLLLLSATAAARELPVWALVAASPTQSDVLGVAYGNGLYVAVTDKTEFLLSTDGKEWSVHRYPNRSVALNDIAYGNGYFVAVGDRAPILVSGNGMGWKESSYDAFQRSLRAVAYCGNHFVAVGDGGTILTSPTGEAWSVRPAGTSRSLLTVACSDSRIVVAGDGGTILTSTDGTAWAAVSWPTDRWLQLNAAAYGPTGFVLAGKGTFGSAVLHSPDGVTWKQGELPAGHSVTTLTHIGDSYIAFGLDARQAALSLTSTDGFRWSPIAGSLFKPNPAGPKYALNDLTGQGPSLVAVGSHGLLLQAPGRPPSPLPTERDRTIRTLAFGSARFAAVNKGGDLMVSPDLQAWTVTPLYTEAATRFEDVAYGSGTFVAVGDKGAIAASNDDGLRWKQFKFDEYRLNAVAYGNGRFVVAGDQGTLIWGEGGYTWSRVQLQTTAHLTNVEFTGGRFVVSGSDGTLLTSNNGTDWWSPPWQSYSVARYIVESPAVVRLEIRKRGEPVVNGYRSGESYPFMAYGYDSAGREIGPVAASWSIVYQGMNLPASGTAPVATLDKTGNFMAFGRGPVTIRAGYRGITTDLNVTVVPGQPGQTIVAPPFFPSRFPSFSVDLSPKVHQSDLRVGVTYKLTAYGVTENGRITSEVLKPFWCLSNLEATKSARAILDSEGNLTILEPGTVHIGAVFGNGGQYMMVTAHR